MSLACLSIAFDITVTPLYSLLSAISTLIRGLSSCAFVTFTVLKSKWGSETLTVKLSAFTKSDSSGSLTEILSAVKPADKRGVTEIFALSKSNSKFVCSLTIFCKSGLNLSIYTTFGSINKNAAYIHSIIEIILIPVI